MPACPLAYSCCYPDALLWSRRDVPRIKNRAFRKAFESAVEKYIKGHWKPAMEKLHECAQVRIVAAICHVFDSYTCALK